MFVQARHLSHTARFPHAMRLTRDGVEKPEKEVGILPGSMVGGLAYAD
ncbi:hypothetical protein RBSH_02636 [Rhodopirellula baltica SH28]|uniref:Uncharacterized protein n=1 Tax=Rhodopirellula baltica SH28 TaxID=993517 RepID=K5DI17_RHOBT|nr:hypothetical protein RBSH_02636 [Rhodopirellula baltica SH28]